MMVHIPLLFMLFNSCTVSVSIAKSFPCVSLFISSETRDTAPDCKENLAVRCDLGGCIDKSKVCDFHTDCPLGEDEGFICGELDSAFESFHRAVKAFCSILLCNVCFVLRSVANQCKVLLKLKPCKVYCNLCICLFFLKMSLYLL